MASYFLGAHFYGIFGEPNMKEWMGKMDEDFARIISSTMDHMFREKDNIASIGKIVNKIVSRTHWMPPHINENVLHLLCNSQPRFLQQYHYCSISKRLLVIIALSFKREVITRRSCILTCILHSPIGYLHSTLSEVLLMCQNTPY